MNKCKIVSPDWQLTAEGETILQNFYDPQTAGRKMFGEFKAIKVQLEFYFIFTIKLQSLFHYYSQ